MVTILGLLPWIGLGLVLLGVVLGPAIKIVTQWERGVVLRFGKLAGTREPGFNVIIPLPLNLLGSIVQALRATASE